MTRRRTLTGIKFLGNSKPCMMCGGHRCDIRASSQAAAPAPDLKRCNILFPVVAEVSNRVKGRALAPPHSDTERLSDRAQGEEYRTAFKSGESALSPRCLALQTKAEVIIGIRFPSSDLQKRLVLRQDFEAKLWLHHHLCRSAHLSSICLQCQN